MLSPCTKENHSVLNILLNKAWKIFIQFSKYVLKHTGYKIQKDDGKHNWKLNICNFIFLIIYCALSGYNIYLTVFVSLSPPSDLLYFINAINIFRLFLGNVIKIKDTKEECKSNDFMMTTEVYVKSMNILALFEALSLCLTMIFIISGSLFHIDLFGIPSSSVISLMSVIIIIFIGVEGYRGIIINMFQARPYIYAVTEY